MQKLFKRFLAVLLALLMLPVGLLTPPAAQATTTTTDLTQDFAATAGSLTDEGSGTYSFVGAGTNLYNNLSSVASYSGDITLQFDVKFESTDSDQMLVFTARNPKSLDQTSTALLSGMEASDVRSNFVLHTSPYGLRLGKSGGGSNQVKDQNDAMNVAGSADISIWYTVKYSIVGAVHTVKYWATDTGSEESPSVTLSYTDANNRTEGYVAFSKRGSGKVSMRNVQISSTQKTEATVTFKVVNGTWSDGTTADKAVQVPLTDGSGTLASNQVPTGMIHNSGYDIGYWVTAPNTSENGITGDVTYTYSFNKKPQGIDLTDSSLFNYYGEDPIVQVGDEVYQFYGQAKTEGTQTYNKVVSKQAYGGDITMTFDVKFNKTDSDNMLFFSAKASPKTDDVNGSAPYALSTDVYANVVLQLATTSYGTANENVNGLRISKAGTTAGRDNTLCEYQLDGGSLTGTWFTIKYVIENDVHRMKIWPASETEPQEWAIEYNDTNVAFSGYMSFVKRGAGYVELRNVSYTGTPLNPTSLFSVETVPETVAGNVGMSVADLDLPATVNGTLLNGDPVTMNVAWDTSALDLATAGAYTISGTVTMPQGTDNNGNISVSTTVNVLPEGQIFYRSWIFQHGEAGLEEINMFHQFGTMTTMNGTILVYCEARAVTRGDAGQPMHAVLKRSTDGGKTWGPVILVGDYRKNPCSENENKVTKDGQDYIGHCYANPTLVQDTSTGRIFCFVSCNHGNSTCDLFYCYSDDDGQTWTDLVNITHLFANDGDDSNGPDDPYNRGFHLPGPGHGIQLQYGQYAGRLIMEVWHRHARSFGNNEQVEFGLSVLYSDDHGETWVNGEYTAVYGNEEETIVYGCNEGRIAELADGTLVIDSRSIYNMRRYLVSTDGGVTWSEPVDWTSIGSYGNCDSGFVTYVDEESSTTTMITTHIETGTTVRDDLQAYLSYDNGVTWVYTRELWKGSASTGASDVNLLDAETGTYGVLHGNALDNNSVEYIVFNTAWLINNNGSPVTLEGGEFGAYGAGTYPEGATVTIDAGTRDGYTFAGWTTDSGITLADTSASATTFTMPDSAVTVVATWTCNHVHDSDYFDQQLATEAYLKTPADCTNAAVYYKSCSVCGASSKGTDNAPTFQYGAPLDHSFTNYVSDGNATCVADGTKTAVCDRDGCTEKDTVKEAAYGHKLTKVDAKAATCTENGNTAHYHCSACGKNYADAEGKTELSSVTVAAGHAISKVEAKAPTETENGNKEYYACASCGKLYADAEGKTEVTKNSVVISTTGTSPDTGDSFDAVPFVLMMLLSGAAMAALVIKRKEF